MAKHIKTSIDIKASSAVVWEILTDFEKYPEWNPFIKEVKGKVAVGNNIEIYLQGMTFKPVVLTFAKNKSLSWLGHLFFKGLFDGHHKFFLSENPDGTTTLEHSEEFNGILVPLFSKNLDAKTMPGFEAMNKALKERAEQKHFG